jgi:hypothetical protein
MSSESIKASILVATSLAFCGESRLMNSQICTRSFAARDVILIV